MSNYEKMAKLAVEKSLLKEYVTSDSPRTVYMKDGDEFQIQLFNPTSDTVGATIELNGNEIGGMLVLKPGERVWLERYIDDAVKFRFETYNVESNDSDVREAIRGNGDVRVRFYKEKQKVRAKMSKFSNNNWNNIPDIRYKNLKTYIDDGINWNNLSNITCDMNNAVYGCSTDKLESSLTSSNVAHSLYCSCTDFDGGCDTITTSATSATLSMDYMPSDNDLSINNSIVSEPEMIETGRVGKGGYSNQNFDTVYLDFENCTFYTAKLKILPVSRKPVSAADLQKIYCTDCGRKLNTKFKFCPYCGAPTVD